MSPAGRSLLDCDDVITVRYNQGPLLVPDNMPDMPGYQVLASFRTEAAEKGAPVGAMTGTHAIIRSQFGSGNVICFSPHPEVPGGPNRLITEGVRWAGSQRAGTGFTPPEDSSQATKSVFGGVASSPHR